MKDLIFRRLKTGGSGWLPDLRHLRLAHPYADRLSDIRQACQHSDAWNTLMKLPKTIAPIANRTWAQVKI